MQRSWFNDSRLNITHRPQLACGLGLGVMVMCAALWLYGSGALSSSPLLNVDQVRDLYFEPQTDYKEKDGEVFDEKSCVSRYRYKSILHRRGTLRKASRYLKSKLQSYEARHKRCGPYTDSYNKTVESLVSHNTSLDSLECKYVVSIPMNGIGNQMLGFASEFLYALLTDRVLLIERQNIPDLFCEPFPDVSWLLPLDFPLRSKFGEFWINEPSSLGNYLKKNSNPDSEFLLSYFYIHLGDDLGDDDRRFFGEQEQLYLRNVPWLIVRTDLYFVPSLFMIADFEAELRKLFPNKEDVFHVLAHYLFHPTNEVWGLVSRYYNSHLANADVKVGIQIRIFHPETAPDPVRHLHDQILPCSTNSNILPAVYDQNKAPITNENINLKVSVMITSLNRRYFEELKNLFWEKATESGENVFIHQPSFEDFQKTGNLNHDSKALAEIYLLSLTDKLIVSTFSTFGYAAQSLSGIRSWILFEPNKVTTPSPPCRRMVSMEPCYLQRRFYNTITRKSSDNKATMAPYIKPCEDIDYGIKIFHLSN